MCDLKVEKPWGIKILAKKYLESNNWVFYDFIKLCVNLLWVHPFCLCLVMIVWLVTSDGSSAKIFGVPKFWLNYSFGLSFRLIYSWFFKNWCTFFFVEFFKVEERSSIKIDIRIMSIIPTNQIIILNYNFNFEEKSDSRNLTKMTKLHHVFKNRN